MSKQIIPLCNDKNNRLIFLSLLFLGLIVSVICFYQYFKHGYRTSILCSWYLGLLLCGGAISRIKISQSDGSVLTWQDAKTAFCLMLLFSPVYLTYLFWFPAKFGTVEINYIGMVNKANHFEWDWFGLFDHNPKFIIMIMERIGSAMGGVTLIHMRFIHALCGVFIIGAGYLFFRTFASKRIALACSMLLASSHALFSLSRIALRDNIPLLLMAIAFCFLYLGFKERKYLLTYLGGIFTGFGFYNYYPARMIIIPWVVFLFVLFVGRKREFKRSYILKSLLTCLFGVLLTIGPIAIVSVKGNYVHNFNYVKKQISIFPKVKKEKKGITKEKNFQKTYFRNVKNGLFLFNNNGVDRGGNYQNHYVGFVDHVSGIFVWIGALILIIRRQKKLHEVLMLASFFTLYFIYAFFCSRNPHYTRLLPFLLFIVYFVVTGIDGTCTALASLINRKKEKGRLLNVPFFWVIVYGIIILNFTLFVKYQSNLKVRDLVFARTFRYIHRNKDVDNYHYLIVADKKNKYFWYGSKNALKNWSSFFHDDNQTTSVLGPDEFIRLIEDEGLPMATSDFTMFLSEKVWKKIKESFSKRFNDFRIHHIDQDGEYKYIEVKKIAPSDSRIHIIQKAPRVSRVKILFKTTKGNIVFAINPDVVPAHVHQFLQLTGLGAYDSTHFHSVRPRLFLQLSMHHDRTKPLTDAQLKAVKPINTEISSLSHKRGMLFVIHDKGNIKGAETTFLIILGDVPKLNKKSIIFGYVEEGFDTMEAIINAPRVNGVLPEDRIEIIKAGIIK